MARRHPGTGRRPDLGRLDGAVRDEVTSRYQTDHMFPGFVGTGDPGRSVDNPRIDKIANPVVHNAFGPI